MSEHNNTGKRQAKCAKGAPAIFTKSQVLPKNVIGMDKKNVSQLLVNYSYLSAKIFDANGDLGKRWYLEYYVESIRHRQYLNKGKSPNERYQIAANILATFESVALDSPIPYYVNVVLIVNFDL